MGISCSTFTKKFFPSSTPPPYVLMLGLKNAGKSLLLKKMMLGPIISHFPVLGFHMESVKTRHIQLDAWDLDTYRKIRPLWQHYFQHCNAIIYVVDSADKERLNKDREELEYLLGNEHLLNATLLVFANKTDSPGSCSTAEVTDMLGLHKYKQVWFLQACSAITGEGISEGLDWLAHRLKGKSR